MNITTVKCAAVILSILVATASPAQACSGGYFNSTSSQGCCISGPTCECDPSEHEVFIYHSKSWEHNDPCNPDQNFSDWEAWGPDTQFVTVDPWEQYCGVNTSSDDVAYFATTGPDNCSQCGYDRVMEWLTTECS